MDYKKLSLWLAERDVVADPTILYKANNPKGLTLPFSDQVGTAWKSAHVRIFNEELCYFHSYRSGLGENFVDKSPLNTRNAWEIKEQARIQQAALRTQKFEKSQEAYREFTDIIDAAPTSAYLTRKKVEKFGCKVDKNGNTYVPFRNSKGYITSFQTIMPGGFKLFKKDAEIKGSAHAIGFNKIFRIAEKYEGKILIAEGFATGASLHMATGLPTVIAVNAGNLLPVLEGYSKKYPQAKFVICADWDLRLEELKSGKKIWRNPGIESAIICQSKLACSIVNPSFNGLVNGLAIEGLSDFNDLHCKIGIDEVKKQVFEGINSEKKYQEQHQKVSISHQENKTQNNEYILINQSHTLGGQKVGVASIEDVLNYFERNYPNSGIAEIRKFGAIQGHNQYLELSAANPENVTAVLSSIIGANISTGKQSEVYMVLNNGAKISYAEYNIIIDYDKLKIDYQNSSTASHESAR